MKKYSFIIGTLFAAFCLLSIAATPGHAYIVYPDDPYWGPDDRTAAENPTNAGTAGISAENPRSGNASLKLTIGGDNDPLDDWAFYTRTAEDGGSWGKLSEISALSFDWFRATETDSEYEWYDPWNLQTPVLRLLIYDDGVFSELVWERYYTDSSAPLIIGDWVTEDIIDGSNDQNFWRHIFVEDGEDLYTDIDGNDVVESVFFDITNPLTLMAETTDVWTSLFSDYADAVVYGLSVGVGSSWPGEYLGYVDNIHLAFGEKIILDDNFELPVPEPSTLLLLGIGMAALLAGRRRRARG